MSTNLEAVALIAEGIRRATGIRTGEEHLGVGLAMCDQLSGRRGRRATKTIRDLTPFLPTRHDRVLATAIPALYVGAFAGTNVCVMVETDSYAQQDAELYRSVATHFGGKVTVTADPGQASGQRTVAIATPEAFSRIPTYQAVIIARLAPDGVKRLHRSLRVVATLPDP